MKKLALFLALGSAIALNGAAYAGESGGGGGGGGGGHHGGGGGWTGGSGGMRFSPTINNTVRNDNYNSNTNTLRQNQSQWQTSTSRATSVSNSNATGGSGTGIGYGGGGGNATATIINNGISNGGFLTGSLVSGGMGMMGNIIGSAIIASALQRSQQPQVVYVQQQPNFGSCNHGYSYDRYQQRCVPLRHYGAVKKDTNRALAQTQPQRPAAKPQAKRLAGDIKVGKCSNGVDKQGYCISIPGSAVQNLDRVKLDDKI